jgi:Na+-transporting NADH:ubiquinone oxidoreductase subunit NqrC
MEDAVKLKKQLTRTRVFVFILVGLCFLFLVFAYVQMLEADRQATLAIEQKNMAEQARAEAERQLQLSLHMRAEAEQQARLSVVSGNEASEKHETVENLKKELEAQRKIAEQSHAEAKRMEVLARQK